MRSEAAYQAELVKRLEREFPGCWVIKNDPRLRQGVPDLLVLFKDIWFMLEVKLSEDSPFRPNQEYLIEQLNQMSFCMVIYPEIEDKVFYEIERVLGCNRRVS